MGGDRSHFSGPTSPGLEIGQNRPGRGVPGAETPWNQVWGGPIDLAPGHAFYPYEPIVVPLD